MSNKNIGNPGAAAGTASLVHLLHRASQVAEEIFLAAVGDGEPTARQLIVLEVVSLEEKPSQTIICQRTGIDRSTVADIVGRLVSRGLLARRRTRQDSRRYAVSLTEQGRSVLNEGLPRLREADRQLLSSQPASRRADFVAALEKIVLQGERGAR